MTAGRSKKETKAEPDPVVADMVKDTSDSLKRDEPAKIGNILDKSGNREKKLDNSEQSEKGTLTRFKRPFLQRIDQLIDTMAPICAGDDNTLQETAKLAYKILLHGLSDEFPADEAKSEMVAINE